MGPVLKILPTKISDLFVVETSSKIDERGALTRLYCEQDLQSLIGRRRIVQINQSKTAKAGAVRGMHFQSAPHAEMKLVRCIKGRVWDVAVDLRQDSTTFLNWHAEELSSANARMMVIPEGFAHGFQVLEPESELLYLHTAFYAPQSEGGVRHDDPALSITWPMAVVDLSERDRNHPLIKSSFNGVKL